MSEVLTPNSDRWVEFFNRLSDALIIDEERWRCDGTRGPNRYPYAKQIMSAMGGIDIPASIAFFQHHGGFCDCEICFNVDPRVREGEEARYVQA